MSKAEVDLLQGSLDVLILKTLSWGPKHGYAVVRWIQQVTGDVLVVEEGSLYPALHRLERKEWIASEWGVSENNRRARFYSLTPAGKQHLRAQTANWQRFAEAVSQVLTFVPEAA